MSPKLVLVAMLSCTTIIPSNIIFGLAVSVWKYNLDEGLQSFLCIVSLEVVYTVILFFEFRNYYISERSLIPQEKFHDFMNKVHCSVKKSYDICLRGVFVINMCI